MDRKTRVQGALLSRGNSQKSVATASQVSEATVSKIVAGTYPIKSVRSRRTRDAVLQELSAQSGLSLRKLKQLTTAETAVDESEVATATEAA